MTKNLYRAPGQIQITYIVTSIRNGRRFATEENGVNSTFDVKAAVEDKQFLENARLNAVYKHMSRGGNSSAITTLVSFKIKYFTDLVKIEKRKYKNGEYDVVVERKTGKVLGKSKNKYKLDLE